MPRCCCWNRLQRTGTCPSGLLLLKQGTSLPQTATRTPVSVTCASACFASFYFSPFVLFSSRRRRRVLRRAHLGSTTLREGLRPNERVHAFVHGSSPRSSFTWGLESLRGLD